MTTKDYITRYLILKICVNSYKIGEPIPSENQLARQFKCTRLTVRQAYNKLVEMNLLSSKKGVGYFVQQNLFQKVFTPYNFLKDKKLTFKLEKNENDRIYKCVYEIQNQDKSIGYVRFAFNHKLANQEQFDSIEKLMQTYTLDSNLNWNSINEKFGNINDEMINEVNLNKMAFNHQIQTSFMDSDNNDYYTLQIVVCLNDNDFEFTWESSIF